MSLHDPDARPIRKGKLGKRTEFGFVSQLAEVTGHNESRGLGADAAAASTELGNPAEETLLPDTVAELERLGIKIHEVPPMEGKVEPGPTNTALAGLKNPRRSSLHRRPPGTRLQAHTTPVAALPAPGEEGRISHLKRRYGLDRSRLKGDEGRRIWTEWAILAYNTDTLAVRER